MCVRKLYFKMIYYKFLWEIRAFADSESRKLLLLKDRTNTNNNQKSSKDFSCQKWAISSTSWNSANILSLNWEINQERLFLFNWNNLIIQNKILSYFVQMLIVIWSYIFFWTDKLLIQNGLTSKWYVQYLQWHVSTKVSKVNYGHKCKR